MNETQDQLQGGWLKGPFTEADLDARTTATSKKLVLEGLDDIVALARFWLSSQT